MEIQFFILYSAWIHTATKNPILILLVLYYWNFTLNVVHLKSGCVECGNAYGIQQPDASTFASHKPPADNINCEPEAN